MPDTAASLARILVVLTCLIMPAMSAATPFPGPDGFGYAARSIPNIPRFVLMTGNNLVLGDDDVSEPIDIGFAFNFYGVDYEQVYVSANGLIEFGGPSCDEGCYSPRPIPQIDDPNNIIAGLWADLDPSSGGSIRYQTIGSPGSREFVVGWYFVPFYGSSNNAMFEIILHEGTNEIELQYGSVRASETSTSVGIENGDGTLGLQIYFGDDEEEGEGVGPGSFQPFDVGHVVLSESGYLITLNASGVPVPTLPAWALSLLAGLLALLAGTRRRPVSSGR
ncbi:MAG: IPTL-CTERM sorting domain-containing protein [Chromatiales bacterium]|jgi:hypothetical protein|nr:IPTL-CTERM sorting domain-containing protein [Chromatiales bacterium]